VALPKAILDFSTSATPGIAELQTVAVYIDYKSPYAYLAKDLVYELERGFRCASIGCLIGSTSRAFSAPPSSRIVIGVFGVPSFLLDGELFWGREHLPEIREILGAAA
jgi:2-hydroxychromene-2-carboxylate isomerase